MLLLKLRMNRERMGEVNTRGNCWKHEVFTDDQWSEDAEESNGPIEQDVHGVRYELHAYTRTTMIMRISK